MNEKLSNIFFCLLLTFPLHAAPLSDFFSTTEEFKKAQIGICVIEKESGQEIYTVNQEKYFVPASLQKIPLSMAAVAFLGEDFCFKTTLEYEGKIESGVLTGNLWVCGGGDPTLDLDIFSRIESDLKEAGIEKIEGKIIIDPSCFEEIQASPYWQFQDLGNYYGAGASGLTIHQNLYKITFRPGLKEGDPAELISCEPRIPSLMIKNEVRTGPKGSGDKVCVYGSEYSPIQFYRGTVPLDEPTFSVKAAIPNPPLFFAKTLAQKLKPSLGAEVVKKKGETKILATYSSPPLKTILQEKNKYSINLYSEHFLKMIGGGNGEQGALRVENYFKKHGIPAQIKDGSGLARNNLFTPQGYVKLLRQARTMPALYASFPEVGKEGTLRSFPKLHGHVNAKTGHMSNISNLAGYLTHPSGKEYIFAIFCNHYQGPLSEVESETADFLNALIEAL